MLFFTLAYKKNRDELIEEIYNIKKYFLSKNIKIGLSESQDKDNNFIKFYCDEKDIERVENMFPLYLANVIYLILVEEYCLKELSGFINDTYFFLKYDEVAEVKILCYNALKSTGEIIDDDVIYYMNMRNMCIEKIIECIKPYEELNVEGLLTFRSKELKDFIREVVDKVVERYMVEREYSEFIKLLKYFVDVQESKIDVVNILIDKKGEYLVCDENFKDIMPMMMTNLSGNKFSGMVRTEDMIISGLITNCPKKIFIHHAENTINKEFIDTLSSVFTDRVSFCEGCNSCNEVLNKLY